MPSIAADSLELLLVHIRVIQAAVEAGRSPSLRGEPDCRPCSPEVEIQNDQGCLDAGANGGKFTPKVLNMWGKCFASLISFTPKR
jgi:hypothetical protein